MALYLTVIRILVKKRESNGKFTLFLRPHYVNKYKNNYAIILTVGAN